MSYILFTQIGGVKAAADNTWISDIAGYSGLGVNWQNGTPTAGQNFYFTSAHTGTCTWNSTGSFGIFKIGASAGTVAQAASFTVTSYIQTGGTFTGSDSYTLTDSGDFSQTAGTLTASAFQLRMTGSSKNLGSSTGNILFLQVSGTINIITGALTISKLQVDNGASVALAGTTYIRMYNGGAYGYINNGQVLGPGQLTFNFYDADRALSLGSVSAPVLISAIVSATGSRICTLGVTTVCSSTLSVSSAHASNTMTLDVSVTNYSLTAAGITIGTRGILNARGSQITDSGIWNSQNGTFTKGTSSVHLTGASKNLWMESGGMFQNLFMTGSYTLRTNAKTYNYWQNGSLTRGAFTLTINNDQASAINTMPTQQILYDDGYSYDCNATDREGEVLTYGLDTDLLTLSINSTTGIIAGPAMIENGTWYVHVSVTDGNHTVWQNYSLHVLPLNAEMNELVVVGLSLVFGVLLLLVGFKERMFWLLAGPIWIIEGLWVFLPYSTMYMVMAIGLGLVLLIRGALDAIR